jgi:hypothetical protein
MLMLLTSLLILFIALFMLLFAYTMRHNDARQRSVEALYWMSGMMAATDVVVLLLWAVG